MSMLSRAPSNPSTHKCATHAAAARGKRFRERHPARVKKKSRHKMLKSKYQITPEQYDLLLARQDGLCAICRKPQHPENHSLCVDHDHTTGQVRELLCHNCNQALGLMQENYQEFSRYLMRHNPDRSWDRYFLDIAATASGRSIDRSTRVGAVIVQDRVPISTGYNGFPRGIDNTIDSRHERPAKYLWTCHAEENAILNAARVGVSTLEGTLYVTPMAPCSRCARAIIQSQISRVVIEDRQTRGDWAEDFAIAWEMLQEAGVELHRVVSARTK